MNNQAILVSGTLNRRSLEKIKREIGGCDADSPITLVIDSNGGDTAPALEFLEGMNLVKQTHAVTFEARIYRAYSAAAGIALMADRREIDRDGIFEIHIGSITIESNEISEDNRIAKRLAEPVRKWHKAVMDRLKLVAPQIPPVLMTRLHATNRLRLKPEECVQYGIASRTF